MIRFTLDVLEDRISMLNDWFDCCYVNLTKYREDMPEHKTWLDHCVHAMRQIFELVDLAKNAPKEMKDQKIRAESVGAEHRSQHTDLYNG